MVLQGVPHVVNFALGTLTKGNVEEKADMLRQVMPDSSPETRSWFVSLIVGRITNADIRSIEVLCHLIHHMNSDLLWEQVVEETVLQARQIINGLVNPPSGGPQKALRNLGGFLGLLTIGADRPILLDTLDLKRSLIDAIGESDDKMARVLPFLVHSLKASARSTIFHPACSWLAPIFHLLEQLQNEPELKMVFNLEIQSLFTELRENSGPSLVDDIDKLPSRATPIEQDCPPRLPLPTAAQAFTNAFGFQSNMYNMHASDSQMSSALCQYYPQDLAPDLYDMPYSPTESMGSQFNTNFFNPAFMQGPPKRNMFNKLHHTHSAPSLDQLGMRDSPQGVVNFNCNPSYGMPSTQRTVNIPFSKDQKYLWDVIQRLNFNCTQLFKVIPKTKEYVIEAIQPLINDAEKTVSQILSRLSDSVKQSALTILYRDMVLVEDPVVLTMAFQSTFRVLLYAMYEPRSAIEVLRDRYTEAIRKAMEKTSEQVGQKVEAMRTIFDHASQEFIIANKFVIVELISQTIDQFAFDMAQMEYEKMMYERSITLRTNAPRPEMARFIGHPHSMHVLNASLPPKLRRHVLLEAKEHVILDNFESMAKQLQSHLYTLFTFKPPKEETKTELPAVLPKVSREDFQLKASLESTLPDCISGSPVITPTEKKMTLESRAVGSQLLSQSTSQAQAERVFFDESIEKLFKDWCIALKNGLYENSRAHSTVITQLYELGVTQDESKISRFVYVGMQICLEAANLLEKQDSKDRIAASRQIHSYVTAFLAMIDCVAELEQEKNEKRLHFVQTVGGAMVKLITENFAEDVVASVGYLQRSVYYYALRSLSISQLRSGTMCAVPFVEFLCRAYEKLNPVNLPAFTESYILLIVQPTFLSTLFDPELVSKQTASSLFMLLHSPVLTVLKDLMESGVSNVKPEVLSLYSANSQIIKLLYTYYPQVLQDFHFTYVEMLPRLCLHLRNYVLDAAVESNRSSYDPKRTFADYCKTPQMNTNPLVHADLANVISEELKTAVDDYLQHRSSIESLCNLCTFLKQPSDVNRTTQYNLTLINSLVLYLGVNAIDELKKTKQQVTVFSSQNTAEANVFRYLMVSLCSEGLFRLFTSMTDQLRNASTHTAFFASLVLHMFQTAHSDTIREIITRILLERLLASRPHPFGVKVVMAELLTNQEYKFFELQFVHSSPIVERIVVSLSKYLGIELNAEVINDTFKFFPLKKKEDKPIMMTRIPESISNEEAQRQRTAAMR
ncbi:unnamed protein product [Bursaphelenchus okinawaensis]|uniref:Not1 domain-containing protein n=1 Tax=Bursaphelenchus okinawaensis TaxID=465554 RepID=A0A811L6D4_9BILA|nr:unnamed protein product [Bursaphelenchus okinawaensis]CAG9118426.1 unnamed protein product [Bursaphelenchus okinawaensis]